MQHLPYRDSKLTRLLQGALGGGARTICVSTISPASGCIDETIATLRFATRAKRVVLRPSASRPGTPNGGGGSGALGKLEGEVGSLRAELRIAAAGQQTATAELTALRRQLLVGGGQFEAAAGRLILAPRAQNPATDLDGPTEAAAAKAASDLYADGGGESSVAARLRRAGVAGAEAVAAAAETLDLGGIGAAADAVAPALGLIEATARMRRDVEAATDALRLHEPPPRPGRWPAHGAAAYDTLLRAAEAEAVELLRAHVDGFTVLVAKLEGLHRGRGGGGGAGGGADNPLFSEGARAARRARALLHAQVDLLCHLAVN